MNQNQLTTSPSMTTNLWTFSRGNTAGRVLIVGEAWGQYEEQQRKPFVGPSGTELSRMLHEAGINELDCCFTNVVNSRPPRNEFTHFFEPKATGKGISFRGIQCKPELLDGIALLQKQITAMKPELIIGCGNVPLWALTEFGKLATETGGYKVPSGIGNWRGSQVTCGSANIPYLPIYHPAAILRSWDLRYITVHDLKRAATFLKDTSSWKEPNYHFNYKPSFAQARTNLQWWLVRADRGELWLSVDIETYQQNCISVIGIADENFALAVPFFHFEGEKQIPYFDDANEEIKVRMLIKRLLEHPNVRIIGQNYNYDQQYFHRELHIKPRVHHDTMIAHHLMFPGTPKGLSYLASLYLDHYIYWKDESQDWAGGNPEGMWKYNCKDTRYTYNIAMVQRKALKQLDLTEQYQCQLDQWHLAAEMTRRGVAQNLSSRAELSKELAAISAELTKKLIAAVPADTAYGGKGTPWFKSPKVTMDIFYRQLGLPPVLHKKTKKPTMDASAIPVLRKRAPWLSPIFDWLEQVRSVDVFRSHFLDVALSYDERIRCSFGVGATDTFRWNSSANSYGEGTNLQNIPKGDE